MENNVINLHQEVTAIEKEGIVNHINSFENNEKAVILQLKMMAIFGNLQKTLGIHLIQRYKFEYHVGCGRIDLYIVHKDGGVTIVEAKTSDRSTILSAGIGQLLIYEAALQIKKNDSHYPIYINKILCVPIELNKYPELNIACSNAGVKLVSLMCFPDFKKLIDQLIENLNEAEINGKTV